MINVVAKFADDILLFWMVIIKTDCNRSKRIFPNWVSFDNVANEVQNQRCRIKKNHTFIYMLMRPESAVTEKGRHQLALYYQ